MAKDRHYLNIRQQLTKLFNDCGNVYFGWGKNEPERIVVEFDGYKEDINEIKRYLSRFDISYNTQFNRRNKRIRVRIYQQSSILSFLTLVKGVRNKRKRIRVEQAINYIKINNRFMGGWEYAGKDGFNRTSSNAKEPKRVRIKG